MPSGCTFDLGVVWNIGIIMPELVVTPMPPGGPGSRSAGPNGNMGEDRSLGERPSAPLAEVLDLAGGHRYRSDLGLQDEAAVWIEARRRPPDLAATQRLRPDVPADRRRQGVPSLRHR